jgi:hypothetical protein
MFGRTSSAHCCPVKKEENPIVALICGAIGAVGRVIDMAARRAKCNFILLLIS